MTALPLADAIHLNAGQGVKHRTRVTQFGDGYSQRVADGINSRVERWNITWPALTAADLQTVTATLDSVGAHGVLTWTPPTAATEKKYTLTPDGYSVEPQGAGLYSVRATLNQVFDP